MEMPMSVRHIGPRVQELMRDRSLRFEPMTKKEVQAIMKRTRLSHSELGAALGVHNSTVFRWAAGAVVPNQACSMLLRLLADRKVSVELLFRMSSTPYSSG